MGEDDEGPESASDSRTSEELEDFVSFLSMPPQVLLHIYDSGKWVEFVSKYKIELSKYSHIDSGVVTAGAEAAEDLLSRLNGVMSELSKIDRNILERIIDKTSHVDWKHLYSTKMGADDLVSKLEKDFRKQEEEYEIVLANQNKDIKTLKQRIRNMKADGYTPSFDDSLSDELNQANDTISNLENDLVSLQKEYDVLIKKVGSKSGTQKTLDLLYNVWSDFQNASKEPKKNYGQSFIASDPATIRKLKPLKARINNLYINENLKGTPQADAVVQEMKRLWNERYSSDFQILQTIAGKGKYFKERNESAIRSFLARNVHDSAPKYVNLAKKLKPLAKAYGI